MREFFYLLFFNNDRIIGYLTSLFDLDYADGQITSRYPFFLLVGLIFVFAVIAYLLGSINFALVISKVFYHDDIRNYGSHNAGTTNMKRIFGNRAALLTLLGDLLKGVIACLLPKLLISQSAAYLAGLFCILGHCFPAFFKFRGGKGVATAIAIILTLDPLVGLILLAIFVLVVLCTKYISMGSITAAFFFPIVLDRISNLLFEHGPTALMIICSTLMTVIVIAGHHANIKRILNKTESTFSFKKKGSKEASSKENDPDDAKKS
ncbi:MAG: glycerol-3-phosphate 1-O-acyltransferase PlsY [Eubacteriales bacterium]